MEASSNTNQGGSGNIYVSNPAVNPPAIPEQASYIRPDTKYAGDVIDPTATPVRGDGYSKLDFADPAELRAFFDPYVTDGSMQLYSWQTELLESFGRVKATLHNPHKFCLVAANGSGKDSIIASSFAVWFALTKIQSRVIITSSSGSQLTSQTEPAIVRLAECVNKMFGAEYFRIRQRYIKCRLTGSEIRLFATDEAGKAEGYHPMVPGAEMAILINEAKSIAPEIHEALKRCTGFNYWIEYSTPGEPLGFFFKDWENWLSVDLYELNTIKEPGSYTTRVTSYDCPAHLTEKDREEDRLELGEHSALFRSKHLALFTSIGGEVIITDELLNKVLNNSPSIQPINWDISVGIDLAAGGDENALCFTKGNRVLKEVWFRETDTTITADRIEQILLDNNIPKDHPHLYADDGGVGHAIIDMLVRKGWNIKRIMNQWAAINKKQFGNRGAENWYRVKRILEELLIDVRALSEKTRNQLVTRRYKQGLTGARIFLESKKEAKANGRPSPDRADAFILSLTGKTVDDFLKAKIVDDKPKGYKDGEVMLRTAAEIQQFYDDNVTYAQYEGKVFQKQRGNGKRIHGSLTQAMKN